ncbi:MAG: BglII/BstYI family type II restriction endonuclease [Xanthobacteraceae bacterium]
MGGGTGDGGDGDLEKALSSDIETSPNEAADPPELIDAKIPFDIRKKYELLSYRNAAVILSESRRPEFNDLLEALRGFSISTNMIRRAGGNESEIPKLFTAALRPTQWYETIIQGDLLVRLTWRRQAGTTKKGKPIFETESREIKRQRYLDGHKIDYVKNRVAFDIEWNSKDQTFDRDLYAFNAFFLSGIIDVGVLVTRGESLSPVLRQLGPALRKDGRREHKTVDGSQVPRMTHEKYGASTTWWGKLIYRLNAGRNGGCPVLAVGITPACISDWPKKKI